MNKARVFAFGYATLAVLLAIPPVDHLGIVYAKRFLMVAILGYLARQCWTLCSVVNWGGKNIGNLGAASGLTRRRLEELEARVAQLEALLDVPETLTLADLCEDREDLFRQVS